MRNAGGEAFVSRGTVHTVIGLVGDTSRFQAIPFTQLAGVDHVIQVGKPYKMVARDLHPEATTVRVGDTPGRARRVHDHRRAVRRGVRGPSDDRDEGGEGRRRHDPARRHLQAADIAVLLPGTGGARARDPQECRRETGLPIIIEVVDVSQVGHVAEVADCIRVGTRNAQNFELLKEVGLTNKPVMLKRGLAMTIDEWLQAAEYVAQRGNSEIILCERGIRTFEPSTRNTLDLAGMAVAQHESHLPVIVDPSHAVGKKHLVAPMARAAVAAGADGVMIDVHHDPETALCDGPQALLPEEMEALGLELAALAAALDRPMNVPSGS